jgi:hypothetical protein
MLKKYRIGFIIQLVKLLVDENSSVSKADVSFRDSQNTKQKIHT